MKKFAIVAGFVVMLVALVYALAGTLAANSSREVAESWRMLESDDAFAAKFPPVREKNAVAAALERAAIPLGIGLMPKPEMDSLEEGELDAARWARFKQAADPWITSTVEAPDDTIGAPPEEVAAYLEQHRAGLDALLDVLESGMSPLWPLTVEGDPMQRPLPNLLGQMNLSRLLSAASLEAKRAGDGARAWRCQRAAWTVAKGTLSRPEVISQLIGVAIVRGVAGVSRKLDGPAPAWFGELVRYDLHRSMLDSCRAEWSASSEAIHGTHVVEELRVAASAENASLGGILRDAAMRPFVEWGLAEMEQVTVEELLKLEKADPCEIDSLAIAASIDSRVPRLARFLGGDFLPSTHSAFSRVAGARIAVEGTAKIVELKARRGASPDTAWPLAADDLSGSSCRDARWRYERAADGSIRFAFDGRVDVAPGFRGYAIPTEYRAAAR